MRTRTSAVPGRASRTGWSCSLRCSIPISSRAHRSKAERWCGRSSYIVPCGDRFPMRRLAFLALTLATGCSDALEKTSSAGQVIGVINAFDLSLVSAGDTTSVAPSVFPRAVVLVGSRVFVVNSNLVGGIPAGPSWLTSFECCGVRTPDSIPLTGLAASFAVVGDDSLLYVVAAGRSGVPDGKLSIVDPKRRTEVAVLNGLGESPGAVVFHPTGSRLLIASDREGIREVNTSIRAVTRAPGNGIKPGGSGINGLAIDLRGRVYAVGPGGCNGPGMVHVLTAPPDYREIHTVTVGICPTTAAVAATP